jgi:uncharacterized membrane protein
MIRAIAALPPILALAACGPGGHNVPGDTRDHRPFSEIAPADTVHAAGTQSFWSGDISAGTLTFRTQLDQTGQRLSVSRFAGRGGVSFSGTIDGKDLLIALTPGTCSDGRTDRAYPYVATLQLGEEQRLGCGWTDGHPFKGAKAP